MYFSYKNSDVIAISGERKIWMIYSANAVDAKTESMLVIHFRESFYIYCKSAEKYYRCPGKAGNLYEF